MNRGWKHKLLLVTISAIVLSMVLLVLVGLFRNYLHTVIDNPIILITFIVQPMLFPLLYLWACLELDFGKELESKGEIDRLIVSKRDRFKPVDGK